MAKVKYPRCPPSGEIAGWFLDDSAEQARSHILDGSYTSKNVKQLAAWVAQLAKWVEQEEKKLKKEGRI